MRPAPAKTRALRIGVVLGDTVIDERTVRAPASFSIGRAMKNTIAVPVPGLPRSWTLFEMTGDALRLHLAPDMDARVSAGGQVLTRRELEATGQRHGDSLRVVLPARSHGKIELGEVRVLFQEVMLPPPAPRPTLPRSVRGTLADRVDRRLTAFVAASLAAHMGLMLWAHFNDPESTSIVDRAASATFVPETTAIIDASDLAFLDQPRPDPQPAPGTAPTPTPVKPDPAKPPPVASHDPKPHTPAVDPAQLGTDANRYADLLFADDQHGTGPATDLTRRKPGSDLGKQLDEIKNGDQTASIGGDDSRLHDGGGPRPGTAHDPITHLPGDPVTIGPKGPEIPLPPIKPIKPPPRPPRGGDVTAIVKKINTTYMPGLQRCYKASLGLEPTLSGKVMLSFTVSEKGVTSDGRASGLEDKLDTCIEGLMTRWSFAPVLDDDGEPMEVDLSLPLALTPH